MSAPLAPATDVEGAGALASTLHGLPGRCDVVSLHAPGEQVLTDAGWSSSAREGLVLDHTARAGLVDEAVDTTGIGATGAAVAGAAAPGRAGAGTGRAARKPPTPSSLAWGAA